ncbi:hypothetical protein LOC68_00675 [Blastopirellula sp. JC732]|uniref:Uncharacterized protein n=1 Tax=Blastopirellula sediminis TaxID=2894196 RepID=A0A9X1SE81_9BACT|nr:hypothetical protein [Blastopirellula sediminis]MCC9604388.1 hypothetical protein [Blastopirellula sediminis]MCC9626908.1 hypothetical protein [Blastopirellula sediminis]
MRNDIINIRENIVVAAVARVAVVAVEVARVRFFDTWMRLYGHAMTHLTPPSKQGGGLKPSWLGGESWLTGCQEPSQLQPAFCWGSVRSEGSPAWIGRS